MDDKCWAQGRRVTRVHHSIRQQWWRGAAGADIGNAQEGSALAPEQVDCVGKEGGAAERFHGGALEPPEVEAAPAAPDALQAQPDVAGDPRGAGRREAEPHEQVAGSRGDRRPGVEQRGVKQDQAPLLEVQGARGPRMTFSHLIVILITIVAIVVVVIIIIIIVVIIIVINVITITTVSVIIIIITVIILVFLLLPLMLLLLPLFVVQIVAGNIVPEDIEDGASSSVGRPRRKGDHEGDVSGVHVPPQRRLSPRVVLHHKDVVEGRGGCAVGPNHAPGDCLHEAPGPKPLLHRRMRVDLEVLCRLAVPCSSPFITVSFSSF